MRLVAAALIVAGLGLGCATLGKVRDAAESGCGVVFAPGVCDTAGEAVEAVTLLSRVGQEVVSWVKSLGKAKADAEVAPNVSWGSGEN